MANKKSSSCLGLFMRGFVLTALLLTNLSIAGVIVAVKFLGADYATWTDLSSFSSYPSLILFAVLGISLGVGAFTGIAGAFVSMIFGKKKEASGTPTARAKTKPQSNRRTTV